MTQIDIDELTEACRAISRQVRDIYRGLTIHYIVHRPGQRRNALMNAAQSLGEHPAAEKAIRLMQRVRRSEDSAILGTVVARRSAVFGLVSEDAMLSLCTLNLEQFETIQEARRYAWHLAWHAIDTLNYRMSSRPADAEDKASPNLVRRRTVLEMAAANLRADAFSALVCVLKGDRDAVGSLATTRGENALSTRSMHNPEYYPYVAAKEATEFFMDNLLRRSIARKKIIPSALRAANEIGKGVPAETLRHWLAFSEPAQDMAWRGFAPEEILSAAIGTSEDAGVRTIGYLIAEITGLKPRSIMQAKDRYSPYADMAFNEKLHEREVQAVFEDVIVQGRRQRSGEPFLSLANAQNESLTEGRIIGWCAAALQAAGRAYQKALDLGHDPEDKVRSEFASQQQATSFADLSALGKHIVGEERKGEVVTLSSIEKMCGEEGAFDSIRRAVQTTIKDPSYQRRLEAAQEMTHAMAGPGPAAAPRARPATPAPAAPLPAPGLGGGGRATPARTAPVSPPPQVEKTEDQADAS